MNLSKKNWPLWAPIFTAKRSDGPVHRPFIFLLPALLIGVMSGASFPGRLIPVFMLTAACAAFIVMFIRQARPAILIPLIFFTGLGYLSIQPWVSPVIPPHHISRFDDGRVHVLTGIVDDVPRVSGLRTRFVLRAGTIEKNGVSIPVSGRIRMTATGDPIALKAGDDVILSSKIRRIHNFSNPGGFDYERYMSFRKIRVTGYVNSSRIQWLNRDAPFRQTAFPQRLRDEIGTIIDGLNFLEAGPATRVKAVMKALLIGEREGLTPPLRDLFNRSGVSHLLAISGLHIGIVAGGAFFVFQWMLSFCKPLLWPGRTKTVAAVLSFMPVMAYGVLAGMSPSTQRAVIMVGVFLMTYLFDRDQDLINTTAVAALIIIIIHPPTLYSISFQLSFAAVLSIVYGFNRWMPRREIAGRTGRTLYARVLSLFMVSVFATLGTLPIVMHYFNQVSLVGVFANVIVVPLVGFLVVPGGLASVLIALFSPSVAEIGFYACAYLLAFAMQIIVFLGELPFAAVKTITPNMLEIACYYILMWGATHLVPGSSRPETGDDFQRISIRKWAAAAVFAAVFLLGADTVYWVHERYLSTKLRVTVIDVGQGSAALLELPRGYNLLVDGGGFSDNAVFDVGAAIVAPYLWKRKIKTIDSIILSHPNSDHLNGLTYIIENFKVKNAWTNGESSRSKGFSLFSQALERNGTSCPPYESLARVRSINGVKLEILYPERGFLGLENAKPRRNLNNNSLVVKATYGQNSLLFPGDIMAAAEAALVAFAPDALDSSVLVAPHHGSKSSSTIAFLKSVDPEIVVVSAGWRNRYKFPHQKVLQRYADMGCRVYRTDLDGAVYMVSDGKSLRVKPTLRRSAEL